MGSPNDEVVLNFSTIEYERCMGKVSKKGKSHARGLQRVKSS